MRPVLIRNVRTWGSGPPSGTELLVAPAYSLVNGRIALTSADKSWEIAASATNLFDKFF